jgi:hypothetical protein
MRILGVATAVLLSWSTSALSQAFQRNVQDWEIYGSRTDDGRGLCIMEGNFRSGTRIRVILRAGDRTFYFRFTNPAWRSIEQGSSLPLTIEFDADQIYSITASGLAGHGEYGFIFGQSLNETLFVGAFAASSGMSIRRGDVAVDHFNLSGSRLGLRTLVQCTGAVGNGADFDPFAEGRPRRD